jgi:hypothetical protein
VYYKNTNTNESEVFGNASDMAFLEQNRKMNRRITAFNGHQETEHQNLKR